MNQQQEIDHLRQLVAQFDRNSNKTAWLLRRLLLKLRHFPRDFSRRLRRSLKKRRDRAAGLTAAHVQQLSAPAANEQSSLTSSAGAESALDRAIQSPPGAILGIPAGPPEPTFPFTVPSIVVGQVEALKAGDVATEAALADISAFSGSEKMLDLIAKAAVLDPEVGAFSSDIQSYCPPWHDLAYIHLRKVWDLIPDGPYDAVVLMPAGRMGGADLVAAVLARALAGTGRTLILRTDDHHWDRPDWYPEEVVSVDISGAIAEVGDTKRALYVLLTELGARRIYNVNSRLAFETFSVYGARLAMQFDLYAYYFCADRTPEGLEVGYPIWFFANIFPHLKAAMIDTHDLAQTLITRYALPADQARKVVTVYSPALTPIAQPSVAQAHEAANKEGRPRILWGGRLDRQKRFDLAMDIARAMPDVDFVCWGKAVLDQPPDLRQLPANVMMNPPFTSYDELPLAEAEGWLYTSSWDGLPTILIELGALGVPIVASAVGGVPELIDETTGWLVSEHGGVDDYVAALRALLSDAGERTARAGRLQQRVRERHSVAAYAAAIRAI